VACGNGVFRGRGGALEDNRVGVLGGIVGLVLGEGQDGCEGDVVGDDAGFALDVMALCCDELGGVEDESVTVCCAVGGGEGGGTAGALRGHGVRDVRFGREDNTHWENYHVADCGAAAMAAEGLRETFAEARYVGGVRVGEWGAESVWVRGVGGAVYW
jgi:hypothetical protein